MSADKDLFGILLISIGGLLLYAAYKNETLTAALKHAGGGSHAPSTPSSPAPSGGGGGAVHQINFPTQRGTSDPNWFEGGGVPFNYLTPSSTVNV